jgi:RNA polymerase sigma factor (sigma-70 family)
LRRFVHCRDRGDTQGANEAWAALLEESFERVRSMVDLWGRGGRLSRDERDEAVQKALLKLWKNMIVTFEGVSMGQFVNSLRQLVDYACLDVQRAAAKRSGRERSLDELARDAEGDETSRFARAEHEEAAWLELRRGEKAEAGDFVHWALDEMTNKRRAAVLRHTLAGTPEAEIAAEFDTTLNNVQALRSRGMKDLRKLKERYES